jgi:hypothetical protein
MLTARRAKLCIRLTKVFVVLLAEAPLYGQSGVTISSRETASYGAPGLAAQEAYGSDLQQQSPYLGGVPTGKASPTTLSLSLEDAVARGLRQNLGGLLSTDAVSGARGERWQALSVLLPDLTTATTFGVRQNELKAIIGIDVPDYGQRNEKYPAPVGRYGLQPSASHLANRSMRD